MKKCVPTVMPGCPLLAALLLLFAGGAGLRAETPAAAATAASGWTVTASERLPSPAEGVAHHEQKLAGRGGERATLHFLSFDQNHHAFRVLDQEPGGQASLEETMRKHGCLAGTNGGYFRPDFEPVGLLMSDGKIIQKVVRAKLLSGALVVMDNRIELRRNTRPLPGIHAQQAIQSGPFLVEFGLPVPGLNAERNARRTAVFTDGGRRWGLVSASAVTLAELGQILADPALLPGGLKIAGALNLDGGHSTAMWARQPGQEPFLIREGGVVRDFVGIVPRELSGRARDRGEGAPKSRP